MTAPTVPHRFSHDAMATRFELFIEHDEPEYALEAASEAFELLADLERELSRHIESSDVSRISRLRDGGSLPVSPATFDCLRLGIGLQKETARAFGVDTGALVDRWRTWRQWRQLPSEAEVEALRRGRGYATASSLVLEEATHVVRVQGNPVPLDLGGIGKGYALDRMAALLQEWSICRALLHGGCSSVLALDAPQDAAGWPVNLGLSEKGGGAAQTSTSKPLQLQRGALSGSGLEKGPHIIDPRTARPPQDGRRAWAFAPTAAEADALSTAFLVLTPSEVEVYCQSHPRILARLSVPGEHRDDELLRFGDWSRAGLLEA